MVSQIVIEQPRPGDSPTIARAGLRFAQSASTTFVVVIRRLALAIPLLFVISILSFALESLAPGNAARAILGIHSTHQEYVHLRKVLGLNLPLYEQYWRWLWPALHGNLGISLFNGQRVSFLISQRFPVTISLIVCSVIFTLVLGVIAGVFSAVRGGFVSRIVDGVSLAGLAFPTFWLGAVLIVLFAVKFGWFPATGYVPWSVSLTGWLQSVTLPVIALSMGGVAVVARQTREAMLDALNSEYIRMARANGLTEGSIIFRHALRNVGIRIATVLGVQVVGLLGGTVLVESVFALPGLGGLLVSSALDHDVPIVQGIVICFTLIVVAVNLLVDLAYAWLNPRVRVR